MHHQELHDYENIQLLNDVDEIEQPQNEVNVELEVAQWVHRKVEKALGEEERGEYFQLENTSISFFCFEIYHCTDIEMLKVSVYCFDYTLENIALSFKNNYNAILIKNLMYVNEFGCA